MAMVEDAEGAMSTVEAAQDPRPKMSGRPADLGPGLRVETVTDGPLRDKAEAFVYDVYREVGYCSPSERRRVEELQQWADRSVFHVVADEHDDIVGTVRTVVGAYGELPIGQFTRTDFRHGDPLCELGALAVEPTSRSTGVIEHLYRAGWLHAARSEATALGAVIEPWLLEVFTESYALPFEQIGEGSVYLGGYSVPAAMPLEPRTYEVVGSLNPGFLWWNSEIADPAEIAAWGWPIILTDSVHDERRESDQPSRLLGPEG